MEIPSIENYKKEKVIWQEAGEPKRSDERVVELFNICSSNVCGEYIKVPLLTDVGQCRVCTCFLRKTGHEVNKLRWATTKCPAGYWKEEEGYEEVKKEVQAAPELPTSTSPDPNRDRPNGCGCG